MQYWYRKRAIFYRVYSTEYDLALADYSKIIDLNPEYSDSYSERATCYVIMGQYDKANNDFKKAIRLDSESTTPYFNRAKMYSILEEHDKEMADYLKTIELNEEDPEGYYYLALTYGNQSKSFQAVNYFTKAISKMSADLGYIISEGLHDVVVELSDLYLKRAEVYKNVEAIDLMCEDYQNACDLGACESLIGAQSEGVCD